MIQLTERELAAMLTTAAEMGAAKAIGQLRPDGDIITQNEAYRQFGRRAIENLKKRGLRPRRLGTAANSKLAYSLADIKSLTTAIDTADMIVSRIAGTRAGT